MKIPNDIEEKEVLLRLRAGDHHAFETIYFKYASPIMAHLVHLLKSADLAQEIAQETFMAVWESREKIDAEKAFKSYLYKIATNKTYNLFRRAAYDQQLKKMLLPILSEAHSPIEAYIYHKENQQLLHELLEKMPPKQREVFTLFKIEGYSYREISERLGISQSTINTHINRANQFIQAEVLHNPKWTRMLVWALFAGLSDGFTV